MNIKDSCFSMGVVNRGNCTRKHEAANSPTNISEWPLQQGSDVSFMLPESFAGVKPIQSFQEQQTKFAKVCGPRDTHRER